MTHDPDQLERTRAATEQRLLAERDDTYHWTGELSASALSTATAVCALTLDDPVTHAPYIGPARDWLCAHQNADGGWGDTTDSPTNISTTLLCWATLSLFDTADARNAVSRAEAWLANDIAELTPDCIADTICARYGVDRTFSVPILTLCALAGRFGDGPDAWRDIPALPFELGALPRALFSAVGLPVVSYALPALIAVGQVRHAQRPTPNPVHRALRNATRPRTLRVLRSMQPASGGFLEAAPLTSFVAMSLIGAGQRDLPATRDCIRFLTDTARDDGAWPIDTNLRTWVSTLSVKALARAGKLGDTLDTDARAVLTDWLLAQQGNEVHPYTGAAPGAWAWTDLSGGVPDADDTPGALLALHHLASENVSDPRLLKAAHDGISWLMDLQNRDGGIPTFCKGWGKLPFDKSCPDLTAHTLRAFIAWRDDLDPAFRARIDKSAARAIRFLLQSQRPDGAWVPLWFGNQAAPAEENPLYGTALTLMLPPLPTGAPFKALAPHWRYARQRATAWLLDAQHRDGAWGGDKDITPSIEETALAIDALCRCAQEDPEHPTLHYAIARGCDWLAQATREGTHFPPAPIGLYFAKLWYHERLYPISFTLSALNAAKQTLDKTEVADPCNTQSR